MAVHVCCDLFKSLRHHPKERLAHHASLVDKQPFRFSDSFHEVVERIGAFLEEFEVGCGQPKRPMQRRATNQQRRYARVSGDEDGFADFLVMRRYQVMDERVQRKRLADSRFPGDDDPSGRCVVVCPFRGVVFDHDVEQEPLSLVQVTRLHSAPLELITIAALLDQRVEPFLAFISEEFAVPTLTIQRSLNFATHCVPLFEGP
jgi:hypothetical protein